MMHLHTKNEVSGSCGSGVFDVDGHTSIHTDTQTYRHTDFFLAYRYSFHCHITYDSMEAKNVCNRFVLMDIITEIHGHTSISEVCKFTSNFNCVQNMAFLLHF